MGSQRLPLLGALTRQSLALCWPCMGAVSTATCRGPPKACQARVETEGWGQSAEKAQKKVREEFQKVHTSFAHSKRLVLPGHDWKQLHVWQRRMCEHPAKIWGTQRLQRLHRCLLGSTSVAPALEAAPSRPASTLVLARSPWRDDLL